jgi:hypothetical protein
MSSIFCLPGRIFQYIFPLPTKEESLHHVRNFGNQQISQREHEIATVMDIDITWGME